MKVYAGERVYTAWLAGKNGGTALIPFLAFTLFRLYLSFSLSLSLVFLFFVPHPLTLWKGSNMCGTMGSKNQVDYVGTVCLRALLILFFVTLPLFLISYFLLFFSRVFLIYAWCVLIDIGMINDSGFTHKIGLKVNSICRKFLNDVLFSVQNFIQKLPLENLIY